MNSYHRVGMAPPFATCANVRSQNPHSSSLAANWDECRSWLLFAADYDERNDLILERALQVIGLDQSFLWEHEHQGRLWDKWSASTLDFARTEAKNEQIYLQRHLGHCAFVLPRVIRVRARLQPMPFRTVDISSTHSGAHMEAVFEAWMRSSLRGVHQS